MDKYSVTTGGILVMVVGSILVQVGFSESCTNELINVVPEVVGGAIAWFGRYRHGDITPLGFKKK